MIFKCKICGRITESEGRIVICSICNNKMVELPYYKPCCQVEIKNPYNTDIYGTFVTREEYEEDGGNRKRSRTKQD